MTLHKGDVCLVNLGDAFGHEQTGIRPALVLATTDTHILIVIPITSNTDALRFSHTFLLDADTNNGLTKDSVALLFHIRAIDARRVTARCGKISLAVRKEIDNKLRCLLLL